MSEQENKKTESKDLVKKDENELVKMGVSTGMVISGNFDFTEDEALAGMSPVIQGYMKSYRYFMRSINGVFEIRDNQTDEIIEKLETIDKAIIIYAHHTKTLTRGAMQGRIGKMSEWPDEDRDLVALSYDEKSKGSFVIAGVEDYLRKPLWSAVKTRVFVFAMFPSLKTGSEVVACSFGITTDTVKKPGSLANYRLAIGNIRKSDGQPANLPMQFLLGEIYHVPDENEDGEGYRRVCFRLKMNKNGSPCLAYTDAQTYREHPRGMQLHAKVKKSHDIAVEYAESGDMPMLSHSSIPAVSNPAVKSINGSDVVGMAFADDDSVTDDIPF